MLARIALSSVQTQVRCPQCGIDERFALSLCTEQSIGTIRPRRMGSSLLSCCAQRITVKRDAISIEKKVTIKPPLSSSR
jgi:hypothetical protein